MAAAQPDVVAPTDTTASPLDEHAPPIVDQRTPNGPRSGRAVAAMVLGIFALITVVFTIPSIVLGILAIVFGGVARGEVKRRGMLGGKQALAGLILGIVSLVLVVGWLAIAVATSGS
jgi:hypothetical protein